MNMPADKIVSETMSGDERNQGSLHDTIICKVPEVLQVRDDSGCKLFVLGAKAEICTQGRTAPLR